MSPTQSTLNNTPCCRRLLAVVIALWIVFPGVIGASDKEQNESGETPEIELKQIGAEDLQPLLDSHRGKVILVNFWATWCGPCIYEIPALIRLEEKLDPSSFVLVAISVDDPRDSAWLVGAFIEERFPKWNSYLSAEVEDYLLIEELDPYWPGVLPANYVIGPDGEMVKALQGGHSEEVFEAAVRTAMKEKN